MKHNESLIKLSGKTLEAEYINTENSLLMLLFSTNKQFYACLCFIFTFLKRWTGLQMLIIKNLSLAPELAGD